VNSGSFQQFGQPLTTGACSEKDSFAVGVIDFSCQTLSHKTSVVRAKKRPPEKLRAAVRVLENGPPLTGGLGEKLARHLDRFEGLVLC